MKWDRGRGAGKGREGRKGFWAGVWEDAEGVEGG